MCWGGCGWLECLLGVSWVVISTSLDVSVFKAFTGVCLIINGCTFLVGVTFYSVLIPPLMCFFYCKNKVPMGV